MSTEKAAEAAILLEHEGKLVELSNGKTARVRPFNVEELLSEDVVEDLAAVGKAIWQQVGVIVLAANTPEAMAAALKQVDLLAAFKASREPAKRCLSRCIDLPLKQIPLPDLPAVLEAFVTANFPSAQLRRWADLAKTMTAIARSAGERTRNISTISETSARSSSSTGTSSGGSIPPPSSNTGFGGA